MKNKFKFLHFLVISLFVLIGFTFGPKTAANTVDNTVSNTKLTPEKTGYKQSTEFSFDFAVPESAKKGDTTVISLPNELTFQRYESFEVHAPDGQVVAKVATNTKNKALTITYTGYVEKKNDITGHIAFNVIVDSEVVKQAQEVSATIKINGKSPAITIGRGKITYLGPAGEPDTLNFWKYGVTTATNTITYYVNINTAKEAVSDVVIADTIKSPDLQYEEGSFKISEGDFKKNDINYWTLENRSDVTDKYNVELSGDKTSFKINLGNISRGILISYRVKANYNLINGEVVENNITYSSGTTKKGDYTSKFAYQGASGTASGYNYSLSIKKVNEEGIALKGAEFTVTRKATGQKVGTLTTGEDGTATITGLLKDEYILKETKAPRGYDRSTEETLVVADDFGSDRTATKEIVNKKTVVTTTTTTEAPTTTVTTEDPTTTTVTTEDLTTTTEKPTLPISEETTPPGPKNGGKKLFPKTGESSSLTLVLSGLSLIGLVSGLIFKKRSA